MRKIIAILSCFLILVSFMLSCRKERKNPFWDIDLLAPILKSTLTINNIIPDSIIHQNPNNSLELVYKTSLFSFNADSIFKIRDTTLSNAWPYILSTPTVIPPGGSIHADSNNIKNNIGNVQLTNATFRNGKMLLTIKSGIHGKVNFNYKISSARNPAGKIFDTTVTIPAAIGTIPATYSGSFDLSGYKVDLRGPKSTSYNTMRTSYSAIATPDPGNTITINMGDAVQISNTFTGIVMEYAKGYFGHSVTNIGPTTTNFPLFKHITDGTLNIKDINIDFNIENSIGDDARVTITNFTSINSRTANQVPLQHPIIGSPININRAVDKNGNVTPSVYQFSIKPSSPSNVLPFIENFPDKLSYQLRFEINPLGSNVSGTNDFIYYNKLLKTEMNMTIPLSLVANGLTMADTVDFKMDANTTNINSGNFYLYAENRFPFNATIQLYAMDNKYAIVDSLIASPNSILAPPLDVNLVAKGTRLTKLRVPADAAKLSLLRKTKKMYVKIKFDTAAQPNYVKIYSFYEIKIKLVGDFNYTIGKN